MIFETLMHIALVLGGIILLTLIYYLVAHVSGSDTPEESGERIDPYVSPSETRCREKEGQRAVIICDAIPPSVPIRYRTAGYTDCRTQNMVFNGNLVCEHGCLGLGSCVKICPNGAITLRDGKASISGSCTGCGFCVDVCPKKLIVLVPANETPHLYCAARGKTDASGYCKTAKDGYRPDFRILP